VLKLLAFTLPLCLDTFAVSFGVLGEMNLTRAQRIRVSMLFIAFEAGMPLAGMAIGTPLTHFTGVASNLLVDGNAANAYQLHVASLNHAADTVDQTFAGRYIAPFAVPVAVGGIGLWMLDESLNDDDDDDDDETGKARALVTARGLSIIALGIGISLDELVMGFTLGFTTIPVRDVLAAIVIQAILAILAGQLLGWKVRTGSLRLSAERITAASKLTAGGVLVALSAVLLLSPAVSGHLIPHLFPHHRYIPPLPPKAATAAPRPQ
jgi:manganese efflux pump family protein